MNARFLPNFERNVEHFGARFRPGVQKKNAAFVRVAGKKSGNTPAFTPLMAVLRQEKRGRCRRPNFEFEAAFGPFFRAEISDHGSRRESG